jgi:hypothetical protein
MALGWRRDRGARCYQFVFHLTVKSSPSRSPHLQRWHRRRRVMTSDERESFERVAVTNLLLGHKKVSSIFVGAASVQNVKKKS